MRGQEDHEKKRRRQRFWILAAIIVMVIRTVVVAVTIPGSSKNNTDAVGSLESQQGKSNETTAPTFGITNTPTMNPTTPPPSVPGIDNSTLDYRTMVQYSQSLPIRRNFKRIFFWLCNSMNRAILEALIRPTRTWVRLCNGYWKKISFRQWNNGPCPFRAWSTDKLGCVENGFSALKIH